MIRLCSKCNKPFNRKRGNIHCLCDDCNLLRKKAYAFEYNQKWKERNPNYWKWWNEATYTYSPRNILPRVRTCKECGVTRSLYYFPAGNGGYENRNYTCHICVPKGKFVNKQADPLHKTPEYKAIRYALGSTTTRMKKNGFKPTFSMTKTLKCSVADFKVWIEQQFKPGMSWDNHGKVWHLDHIKPITAFDLSNPKEAKKINHWFNLQPLFAEENLKKSNKI